MTYFCINHGPVPFVYLDPYISFYYKSVVYGLIKKKREGERKRERISGEKNFSLFFFHSIESFSDIFEATSSSRLTNEKKEKGQKKSLQKEVSKREYLIILFLSLSLSHSLSFSFSLTFFLFLFLCFWVLLFFFFFCVLWKALSSYA